MAGAYRYYAFDINTNTKLAELPCRAVTFDSRLNDSGSFSGTLDLQAPGVSAQVQSILSYEGNPFKLYVDKDGSIVWAGEVWTGTYAKSSGALDLGGKELLDHFAQRTAVADYSSATYPAGVDPALLIAQVINDAQNAALSGPGSSIGLQVVASASGLPAVVPGYPLAQHSIVLNIVADMIQVVSPGAGGVDVSLSSVWDANGNPIDTLRVWSPRVGRAAGATGLILNLDDAIDYSWPTDATQAGNTLTITGAGNGNATPQTVVNAPSVPVGGLGQAPRLDKVLSYPSVQTQSQVSLMANGLAQQYGRPLTTPTVTVRAEDPSQPLGSWIVGDDVRVYTPGNDRFPGGKDEFWRIVQQEVTVPDEGVATVKLTLNRPPTY
jgi:hypothetical protein